MVGALTVAGILPVSAIAHDDLGTAPNADSIEFLPWQGGPPDCDEETEDGVRVVPVADGTYGDGTLGLTVHGDTFDWALTPFGVSDVNITVVMVQGGPDTIVAYFYSNSDDWDANLQAAINPSTEKPYELNHVDICFDKKDQTEPTPTPTPVPTPTPQPTPPSTCEAFGNCPQPTPTPRPTPTPPPLPTPTPVPTPTPEPSGEVAGETGTPAVTLPPTDALSGGSQAPSGESWRLVLLAMAGILAATLLLTPTESRRKNR